MTQFTTAWDYKKQYDTLKDGYYEYYVCGEYINLLTIWENGIPWIRVVEVDWNNRDHINADAVRDIKPDDEVINQLRTYNTAYNLMAQVDKFKIPTNLWLTYPHRMFVHSRMERFSSVDNVSLITGSNLLSFTELDAPQKVNIQWDDHTVGFGTTQGDQFFAYGSSKDGFCQDFSGSGKGAVYVR